MEEHLAEELMNHFAKATGLTSGNLPRRYLWTDAFAVSNFLVLHSRSGDASHLKSAMKLVEQVHHVLGRYRPQDPRSGWISGLSDEEGEKHPTRGGLRIGKQLEERDDHQPYEPATEWDRDGQYFHYLTKWMHALKQMFTVTRETCYLIWAQELAETAYRAFVYRSHGDQRIRMFWKMSTDLSRPLVNSMGQLDPLDGFVTFLDLQATAKSSHIEFPELERGLLSFLEMSSGMRWITGDCLGIGELLADVARLILLPSIDERINRRMRANVLTDTIRSLELIDTEALTTRSANHRLAFRELGLSIGLNKICECRRLVRHEHDLSAMLDPILEYTGIAAQIEAFWKSSSHRTGHAWDDHADINNVMLATSLLSNVHRRNDRTEWL